MKKKEQICLFVYGTLTDPELLKAITGRFFQTRKAVLKGYRKIDPSYANPVLLPDPRHDVHGFVLLDVDEVSLQRLDRYEDEGHIYRRCKVRVWVENEQIEAYTYFGEPQHLLKIKDLKTILEEISNT